MSSTTASSVTPLAATSSPISATFGAHRSAHSSVRCDAFLPITLTKCQYFPADRASEHRLPIVSAYTPLALSNPNDTPMPPPLRSSSIVLGTPTTAVRQPGSAARCSARNAALVLL